MKQIPIMVAGALGRMGREIIERAYKDEGFFVTSAMARAESLDKKPEHWLFPLSPQLAYDGDAVIVDFSHHALLPVHAAFAIKHKLALLVGCTGHNEENMRIMAEAATVIPLLYAPNTSLMVQVMVHISKLCASLPGVSGHIIDIHHQHKKDAPSGTALALKAAMLSCAPDISSVRVGEVRGEHRVQFFKENEQLEISHQVVHRSIFAEGALFAAQFLFGKAPGLYNMGDVLNLKLTIENRCIES